MKSVIVCCALFWFLLFCSQSEAAIALGKDVATQLIRMEGIEDCVVSTVFVFLAYTVQYLGFSGFLEYTNPLGAFASQSKGQQERRKQQVISEMTIGIKAMLITVIGTMLWMFYVEPLMPFYGYFQTHEYNWKWFLGSVVAYVFWFDTYFFFTHKWLHEYDFLWYRIHKIHHQFKEPSAFAQFATHPIEAAIQGPIGHYIGTLFFPFHPIALAGFGFFSSLWAMCAHDGRWMDFNSHYYHHSKGRGRMNYFNLAFLVPFWDIVYGTRWHEKHPLWMKWQNEKGKKQFDTETGTQVGKVNDAYGAYTADSPFVNKF